MMRLIAYFQLTFLLLRFTIALSYESTFILEGEYMNNTRASHPGLLYG
jgi:hypothetical protein